MAVLSNEGADLDLDFIWSYQDENQLYSHIYSVSKF